MKRHCEQKPDHQDVDPYSISLMLEPGVINQLNLGRRDELDHETDGDDEVGHIMDTTSGLESDTGFVQGGWGFEDPMEDIEEPSVEEPEVLISERFPGAGAASVEFF
jgi:hypothetical protein